MKTSSVSFLAVLGVLGAIGLVACSSSADDVAAGAPSSPEASASDAQTPPTTSAAAVAQWLTAGSYKAWACEAQPHAARSPSPHGINRICSNALLSSHGGGEFPVGAAGVKELYDAAGAKVVGYAVYRKVAVGQGEAWYWYEATDASGVTASGLGSVGTAKTVCVGCHAGAGSDANHSGHDFVYTQVRP